MRFENKTVLITGGATGIGLATARHLSKLGARIFVADLNGAGAQAAVRDLSGGTARGFACDIRDEAQVTSLRDAVLALCDGVDLLINNAARPPVTGPILGTEIAEWRDAFDINVLGYVRMIQAFVPSMLARRTGHIVNTSSGLALLPDPPIRFMGPYIATKGAQLSMSYAFAHALAGTGVSISVFCPGVTAASDRDGAPPPAPGGPTMEDFRYGVPARRAGAITGEEAAAILIAGLEKGDYLTCSQEGYLPDLIAFAQGNLDPHAIVREALAEKN